MPTRRAHQPPDEPVDLDGERASGRGRLHRVERGAEADPYDVRSEFLAAPPLPGEAVALADRDALIDAMAADIVAQSLGCVRRFGDFHLALAGDAALEPLYERLMVDPNFRALPWQRTHLWMACDRCVAFDDAASGFRRVRETIVDHSDIPPEQVHPMFPLGEAPAEAYEAHLRQVLAWREKGQDRLDVAVLAAGADGSVAGLVPGSPALREAERLVAASGGPPESRQITMTLPLLNATRFLAVLAAGPGRSASIRRVVEAHDPFEALPLKGLRPLGGTLKWYLDADAARW